MTTQHNIPNKDSMDERVAESIAAIVELFQKLQLDYSIFGSCGIQTYFNCFFRLPNDLDVIVRRDAVPRLKVLCAENGHQFTEEVGRSKLQVNGFPVHVIPEVFSSVNKLNNTIFARIDLGPFLTQSVVKRVILPCATSTPNINVVSAEMCLFLDLIRTINTNSLMTAYFVFRHLEIDEIEFRAIVQSNNFFEATILKRLHECSVKLNGIAYFSQADILVAQNKIASIRECVST